MKVLLSSTCATKFSWNEVTGMQYFIGQTRGCFFNF